ncbi:MAG TPA: MFS transporter [Candidatus Binatia bacterium]|nr:MFS transporter [Candidatus Binatia bacterium]
MEFVLRSPSAKQERAEALSKRAVETPPAKHPLEFLFRLRAFEALRHREYRLLWYGQIFASMGTWMDQVTRGWLIYELTDSALQLGLVRGIQAIPFLLLSPIAGSAADRYSRKTQVVLSQILNGLLYAVTALLIFAHLIKPWHVYVTAFLMACVQVFLQPSRAAMISDLVPAENLTNAIGLNAVVFNMARSTGPALSGLLISLSGTGVSYSVQAAFFFLATVWTVRLRSKRQPSTGADGHAIAQESFGQSIVEGWKFSWRKLEVRSGLLVVVFASLFMIPFSTLLPVFARDLLHVGAQGQGLLLTAMGIGALCSSLLIASVGDRLPRGILMLCGVALYGLLVVVFSASPWFSLSMATMAVIGLCHVSSHALVQTVIQAYSPREYRGRTMALFHMSQVLLLLGGMLIGALSALIGAPWAAAAMSIVGTFCMIALYILVPAARHIR